jgi:two-component system, NtrC family, nitrogen regulation sensor histidine kinase NtrY
MHVDLYPRLELGVAALTILLGVSSYAILTGKRAPADGLSPMLTTGLLVLNLVPLMVLLVLIARRLAILLSNRRQGLAGAKLHVRLVALFASIAAVPTLLVVVFASLLFQFGVQFWFSDRAKTVLDNADRVAQAYVAENKARLEQDVIAMAGDVRGYAVEYGVGTRMFADGLAFQVAARNLSEAAVFTLTANGPVILAQSGLDSRPLANRLLTQDILSARAGQPHVITTSGDRIEGVVRIDPQFNRYIYVSRKVDPQVLNQVARTQNALSEYKSLIERSRALQWRFNLILIVVSLIILAVAVWFALWLANRLVAPIARLSVAAKRVGAGDLDARVPVRGATDEIGTLSRAFNRMTGQLKAQQSALVSANRQLDRRRQFTEAVLSGVSAGVMSVDEVGMIRLVNHSAADLLESSEGALAGTLLSSAVPEFGPLLAAATRDGDAEGQVKIARGPDTQTLAVQIAAEAGSAHSFVVTFDDISAQLADQRSAAWADVARRIAHEIKNPLTPIQLSAERLQRKYGAQISDDPETFASLTETIVRQVGDLRRMVDEFSSFARMPKPVFRAEPVLDIVRQTLFLHEVGFPAIAFTLEIPEMLPLLVCDRRQIAQALTNLLKNAAEAVEARLMRDGAGAIPGAITLVVTVARERLVIAVTDNGIGLPAENRERLTEPYVTTRARGTGLGLAIVKKIVEEHGGTLELADAPVGTDGVGGSTARMRFDLRALAARDDHGEMVEISDMLPARQIQG